MILGEIVRLKGGHMAAVLPEATIHEIAATMTDEHVGSVIVRSRAGSILGIVNERAVVQALASQTSSPAGLRSNDIMMSPVPAAL